MIPNRIRNKGTSLTMNITEFTRRTRTLEHLSKEIGVDKAKIRDKCYLEGIEDFDENSVPYGLALSIKQWFGNINSETAIQNSNEKDIKEYERAKIFLKTVLIPLLSEYRFEESDKLILSNFNGKDKIGAAIRKSYEIEKAKYVKEHFREKHEQTRVFLKTTIIPLLRNYQFDESDKIILSKLGGKDKIEAAIVKSYEKEKSKYIKEYFLKSNYLLDKEQSFASGVISEKVLVVARAGSGKTRTLTAKAILLAKKYNIEPNQILLLAFNTDAAKEIKKRIKEFCPEKSFNNVRTFHSLACGILNRPDIENNPDRIIQSAIKKVLDGNNSYKKKLYLYFREALSEFEEGLTEEDYQEVRNAAANVINSNRVYISLDGRYVKSKGEKWISDFFFEHRLTCNGCEVWNAYEKPHRNTVGDKVGIIKPDFTLGLIGQKSYYFVLEFWATEAHDHCSDKRIWPNSNMTFSQYDKLKQEKRNYFGEKLIEVFPSFLKNSRDEFESKIKELLSKKGIISEKRDEAELLFEAYNKAENRIKRLFVSFIQKCSQKEWSVEEIQKQIANYRCHDKEKLFIAIAIEIYQEYLNHFREGSEELQKYDYSMLLPEATKQIHDDCNLRLKYYKELKEEGSGGIKIKDIKYILVDEYQDFSQLFYNFIKKIKDICEAKLFCVGDNWQAINGFAGSELKFFENYSAYFNPHVKCHITTNYRSCQQIVECGNSLMQGQGEKAKPYLSENGIVEKVIMGDYYVDYSNGGKKEDEKYKCFYRNNAVDTNASMLLKAVHEILSREENIRILQEKQTNQKDVKCLILTRRNGLFSFGRPSEHNQSEPDGFIAKLINCFIDSKQLSTKDKIDWQKKIVRKTVHRAKGEEAEIVILVNCCKRNFPLIHPDNRLFKIFGITEATVLDEERRLFYVAITRARKHLYLLTEERNESSFLSDMNLKGDFDNLPF